SKHPSLWRSYSLHFLPDVARAWLMHPGRRKPRFATANIVLAVESFRTSLAFLSNRTEQALAAELADSNERGRGWFSRKMSPRIIAGLGLVSGTSSQERLGQATAG